jgi:hypothetical protein
VGKLSKYEIASLQGVAQRYEGCTEWDMVEITHRIFQAKDGRSSFAAPPRALPARPRGGPYPGDASLYGASGRLLDTFPDPNFVARRSPPGTRIGVYFLGYSVALSGGDLLAGPHSYNHVYLYGLPSAVAPLNGNDQNALAGTDFGTQLDAQVTEERTKARCGLGAGRGSPKIC